MRVLVACEYSGRVREAFQGRGHDAWSCDLLHSEDMSLFHIRGPVQDVLAMGCWDLVIAHPPCTYLCNSGVSHLKKGENDHRMAQMRAAAEFFRIFLDCGAPRVCIENPVPHKYARERIGRPSQYVQPYMFGHPEQKKTGLWLKGLPNLDPTHDVEAKMRRLPDNQRQRLHYLPPGPDRWKERSRTYQGIADAMASQWG